MEYTVLRCAIMQPTYLPWLGYFALMSSCDVFVILDNVQFEKRSWQQRNQIKTKSGAQWLTVPVLSKGRFTQPISTVSIDPSSDFGRAHVASLRHAYGRAPFFDRYIQALAGLIQDSRPQLLADLTLPLISLVGDCLGIKCKIQRASELAVEGSKDHLLASICRILGANEYISPMGSSSYLTPGNALEQAGINVSFNDYLHPEYTQLHGAFLPYMSAIDALFMLGTDAGGVMRSGLRIIPAEQINA